MSSFCIQDVMPYFSRHLVLPFKTSNIHEVLNMILEQTMYNEQRDDGGEVVAPLFYTITHVI